MEGSIKSFLFKNTSTKQTIAKNTMWLSLSHIVGRVIKAGLMIYAARLLGAAGYGVFSYVLSLSVFFSITADIGMGAFVTRQISSAQKIEKDYLATALVIKIFLIGLSMLGIIFVAPAFTKIPGAGALLPAIALLIALDGIRDFVLAVNRAKEKMEIEATIHILTNIAIVVVGLFSLSIFGTSRALMVAYTIGSGIGLAVALAMLGKYFRGIWKSFQMNLVRPIIQNAWPFALLGLLGVVMINTDIIMLGLLRDASEVGLYSAAQKPIQVLYVIPAILASAFLPAITKLVNKEDKKLREIMEQAMTATLLIGLPIILGGIILGEKLMNFMFGSEYAAATLSFQILLITIAIVFPSVIIANAVFAYDKQKSFIGLLALGALGNIIFNLLLIPKYGITGSAVATIGAELSANTFIWLKMKRINNFKILRHTKRIIPATILMVVGTILMKAYGVNVAINIIASSIIYFWLLKILKEPMLKKIRGLI